MRFDEVVPYLKKGSKFKREHWEPTTFIKLNKSKNISIHSKDTFPANWNPTNADILAEDWHFVVI